MEVYWLVAIINASVLTIRGSYYYNKGVPRSIFVLETALITLVVSLLTIELMEL